MKKHAGLMGGFLVFALLLANAKALSEPSVTFIPPRFSANASFFALADPGSYSQSLRVMWIMPDSTSGLDFGSFPRETNRWICYFSNTDSKSSCGPTPFPISKIPGTDTFVNYTFKVEVTDAFGQAANQSDSINVGNIQLPTGITINETNRSIYILTSPNPASGVSISYKLYNSSIGSPIKAGTLKNDPATYGTFGHVETITDLKPGEYYLALEASGMGTDFGGDLLRFEMPGEGSTTPAEEKIDSDDVILSVLVTRGDSFTQGGYTIRNTENSALGNLSVSLPPSFSSLLSIQLSNTTIGPMGTLSFTMRMNNVQNPMDINTRGTILSGNATVGYIPINISLSVAGACQGDGTPCICGPSKLSVSPFTWNDDFVVGQTASKTFILTNNGDEAMTGITSSTGDLGSAATVNAPASLIARGTGNVAVSLSPTTAGIYMGAITLTSGSNSAAVLVSLKFSANVSSDIEVLNTEFTDYRANLTEQETTTYASLITDIDSDITTAQNYASSGNMDSAKQRFDSAETKFEMFRNVINLGGAEPGTGQPLDMTLVMMVGAAVAVVVIVVLVLKRRGRGGESKEEAEGGEEFEENIEGEEL